MFARRGTRTGIAAILASALIAGVAFLGAGAAHAEELPADPAAQDIAPVEAPAAPEAPAPAEPIAPAAPEVPAAPEAPADAAAPAADEQAGAQVAAESEAPAAAAAAALPGALEQVRKDGGALDWGFKSSWRGYISSQGGTQTAFGGSSLNGDGTVRYPESSASTYNPETGEGVIAYTGGVHWENVGHGFSIVLQNPRISFAANGSATVSAEMSTTDDSGPGSVARVVIADIPSTGTAATSGGMRSWTGVAGVFAGTVVPGGFAEYAGQATDALTFSTPDIANVPPVDAEAGSFEWGVRESFRNYVRGPIAHGRITVSAPASGEDVFRFPQITGGDWNAQSRTGSIHFSGNVNFYGHDGALNLNLANPVLRVVDASRAELRAPHGNTTLTIATLDLARAAKTELPGGAIRYSSVPVALTPDGANVYLEGYLDVSAAMDDAAFTVGAAIDEKPVTPPAPPATKPKPKPSTPQARPVSGAVAGSLTWGISSDFADYTTNKSRPGGKSGGKITTNGVGGGRGGYIFPQSTGGSWSKMTQTGTVHYSGVVTFTAHKGLMNESFANPVIRVTSATSGTISAGGRTFGLNLGAASKSVGSDGSVTWRNVPVSGAISGGSGGSGGSTGVDPLSFTVGVASSASFGSSAENSDTKNQYTAAATPPSRTGITVTTDPDKIRAGGRIEFESRGFEPNDDGILVVLYSDPVILDEEAKADADGVVRWSGTLPKDVSGDHVITLQGSTNTGAEIKILEDEKDEAAKSASQTDSALAAQVAAGQQAQAGILGGPNGMAGWEWWAIAASLVAIAACTSLLARRQLLQQRLESPSGQD